MEKSKDLAEKIFDNIMGIFMGAYFGFTGGLIYSLGNITYQEIFNPNPIQKEYRKIEDDVNMQAYYQLRNQGIEEFMKKPELLEKLINLSTNPQVNRYTELSKQINEDITKTFNKNILQRGIPLGILIGAIFDIYRNKHKRKQKI